MSKIKEDGGLELEPPGLGKVDSKFSTEQNKARNNRIGDFPEGTGEDTAAVPNGQGVEAKLAAGPSKDATVFAEDPKSADEFLKRITKFIADMDELTPYTVNG